MRYRFELVRGDLTRAAETLRCQSSHLSRVISEDWHLTMDQAYLLCLHWRLRDESREYFLISVEYERAARPEFKEHLKQKLVASKNQFQQIKNQLKKPLMGEETVYVSTEYFSSWLYPLLHQFSACTEFQTIPDLARRLQLDKQLIELTLEKLKIMDLVEKTGERWVFKKGHFHIDKKLLASKLQFHNFQSLASISKMKEREEDLHFTSYHAISRGDIEILKSEILKLIKKVGEIATPSPSEEVVCLGVSLFIP